MNTIRRDISQFSNVPFSLETLRQVFPSLSRIAQKAQALEQNQEIIRLKRGMYIANPQCNNNILVTELIANHIYGPSYVSMESALRFYGLIPEMVFNSISLTTGTARTYHNDVGTIRYIHCNKQYFSIGLTYAQCEGTSFIIATPEKALCDKIIFTPNLNLRYRSEIATFLEEDLRFDTDELANFNLDIIHQCATKGRKKAAITQLINYITHEYHHL